MGCPAIRGELQARHVVQRHHDLIGANVTGVRDPPPAVLAPRVTVLVERRALDQHAILGSDHGVLEAPGAAGRRAVDIDLRLARGVHGDDVRPELVPQERDDLIPAGEPDRLAEGQRAVVHRGAGREHVRYLVPQLQVDAAQVAVLQPADLLERGKVHGPSLRPPVDFPQEPVLVFRCWIGGPVRFCYAESMTDPSFYAPLARAAEEAGYHSMVVPDSICYPRHCASRYPFSPDGSREFLEDKPFIEPFSLIPALGAVTTHLRFVTFVVKLPLRNPVLVAKQATSVAVLTGNRLVLGVGTSPWREDYEVLGVPWADRGRRMDEGLAI